MLSLASAARIIIHPGATDMRYGIRGLSAANGVEPMGYLERALSHTLEAQDPRRIFSPGRRGPGEPEDGEIKMSENCVEIPKSVKKTDNFGIIR